EENVVAGGPGGPEGSPRLALAVAEQDKDQATANRLAKYIAHRDRLQRSDSASFLNQIDEGTSKKVADGDAKSNKKVADGEQVAEGDASIKVSDRQARRWSEEPGHSETLLRRLMKKLGAPSTAEKRWDWEGEHLLDDAIPMLEHEQTAEDKVTSVHRDSVVQEQHLPAQRALSSLGPVPRPPVEDCVSAVRTAVLPVYSQLIEALTDRFISTNEGATALVSWMLSGQSHAGGNTLDAMKLFKVHLQPVVPTGIYTLDLKGHGKGHDRDDQHRRGANEQYKVVEQFESSSSLKRSNRKDGEVLPRPSSLPDHSLEDGDRRALR
ncbi:unnamed protein product, partial [Amoebophrya sp. A25]